MRVSPSTAASLHRGGPRPSGTWPGARHMDTPAADGVLPGRVPGPGPGTRPEETGASDGEDADDVAHGVGGGGERRGLGLVEVDLDDPLDAGRPEHERNAHVEPVDAVLAVEQRRAREQALLIEDDRVHHLRARGAWGVPGRGAEQLHELAAADGGALPHRLNLLLRDELPQRHAADAPRAD